MSFSDYLCSNYSQWRIQDHLPKGDDGERGARAYNGGLGAEPQPGSGSEPLEIGN